jgi:hypothetical protein
LVTEIEVKNMDVNWTPPEPRAGLARQWDTLIGPGATRAENALILAGGLGFVAGFLAFAAQATPGWSVWQWLVMAVLALDLSAATIAVLRAPHYLQRPVAMFAFCAAILLNLFFPDPLLNWFVPVLFLKLVVAHLVKEAPFGSAV